MDVTEAKGLKAKAIGILSESLPTIAQRLRDVDERLLEYLNGCTNGDVHCCSEVLCALKFVRVFQTYEMDIEWVQRIIRMYEGRWEWKHGAWRYLPDSGGLQFSSLRGRTYYRLQPFQLFILAWIFGFYHEVKVNASGDRGLLPTERMGDDGQVYDRRRLVTEAVIFIPRKAGKTTLGAFIQFVMFFFGDANGEIYCAAQASSQSHIIYNMIFDLIHQLDPQEKLIRFTASQINWKRGQARQSKIEALTAGGKTKDGMNPLSVASDEFGSASWTNERCDMVDLLNVLYSGMGVRREPLVTHTTTAGYATNGPFAIKLDGIKQVLRHELDTPSTDGDFQACIILEPDEWERDEESLFTDERIWRKVNPMIGVSVQPNFYKEEVNRSMLDPTKRKETITKLFNVYSTDKVKDWIKAEQVRRLQIDRRITDCKYDQGWITFVGLDFSHGDDLYAITYLAVNINPQSPDYGQFFADGDAWIVERMLKESPNRSLYELWVEQGWMHVSPGEVLNPDLPIDRMMQLSRERINFMMFGYDSYQAKQPINTISAWLQSLGANPDKMVLPVRQTFANYNGLVGELEYMMLSESPILHFSQSPLWPWQFANCKIETDKYENRKMVKSSEAGKVDNVQALANALWCYDLMDAKSN